MLKVMTYRNRGLAVPAVCSLLAAFWITQTASAQTAPNPEPQAREVVQHPVAATQPANLQAARIQTGQRRTPASRPAATTKAGCGDKTTVLIPTPSQDGPQPKWACDEPLVTADPIWKGEKIEFAFNVRNDGEGPLKILAKGG